MKKGRKTEKMTFADFYNLGNMLQEISPVSKKIQIIEDAESYLHRGVRLQSLAKERFREICCGINLTGTEMLLFGNGFSTSATFWDILDSLKKAIRRILRRVVSEEDSELKELLALINPGYGVTLNFVSVTKEPNATHRKEIANGDQMLLLIIREEGYPVMNLYGLKNKSHTKTYRDRLYRNGEVIADIATILAYLLLWSVVTEAIKDGYPLSYPNPTPDIGKKLLGRYQIPDEEYNYSAWPKDNPWIIPKDQEDLFSVWESLFQSWGFSYQRVTENTCEMKRSLRGKWKGHWKDKPILFTSKTLHPLMEVRMEEVFRSSGNLLPWHMFLISSDQNTEGYWGIPRVFSQEIIECMKNAFLSIHKQKEGQIRSLRYLKEMERIHARSFETKKNIPKATIAAMEESHFNDYFGYVEYDEEVDISLVKIIEEEWIAFKETYFPQIKTKENCIRFRRLGNHKASGLYYPFVKCLCVDIKSPSSLIHEFGHLIDYCYGNLSAKQTFLELSSLYESRLREIMKKNEVFKIQMNGGSKYNLSYFLTPTEIFARCFELYCVYILHLNNSLTPTVFGPSYPTDEVFLNAIKGYMDALFLSLQTEEVTDIPALKTAGGY